MRVSALDGRLVFVMRRQTLGADMEGKRYENAAIECGHEDYKLLAFELGMLVGCTESITAKSRKGDGQEITDELRSFADWFETITDPHDAWTYRVNRMPKALMDEWRKAWDAANKPLIPPEQKDFKALSEAEQQEAQTEGSFLEGQGSALPTA